MLKIIVLVIFLSYGQCWDLCGDWISYKEIKCIKVLDQLATETEAVNNCTQIDNTSTLVSIHSHEEQEYLNNIVNKYNATSFYSWIGLEYGFTQWLDKTQVNFTNWAKDAVRDGTDRCVQMYNTVTNLGQWTDVSCKKTALIVCQKTPKFDLMTLKVAFENLTNVIEKQQDQLNKQNTEISLLKSQQSGNFSLPIGFLYTQLPNQTAPQELFPNTKWLDVSKEYAGLFFRAEGDGSLPFGQIQQANQSWISNSYFGAGYYDSWTGYHDKFEFNISLNKGAWTELNPTHLAKAIYNLQLFTTGAEVRPKNTAVKIWKRVQ